MSEYVEGCFYHPTYTQERGRDFTLEDGETIKSLTAQGWVDHPAKAGFNPWGTAFTAECDKILNDFKSGLLPAIQESDEDAWKIAKREAEKAAQMQKERDEAMAKLRQLESGQKMAEMKEEQFLDEKSDAGTLPKPKAPKKTVKSIRSTSSTS